MTGGGVPDSDMPIFPWSSRGEVPPRRGPAEGDRCGGLLGSATLPDGKLRNVADAIALLEASSSKDADQRLHAAMTPKR
jgi:hypothetical protein